MKAIISADTFFACDIRVGTIVDVEEPQGLRNRAWVMRIDFGEEIGQKTSVGQFRNYSKEEMAGKQIVSVVNLEPRKVGNYISECLVLGVRVDEEGNPNDGHKNLTVEGLGENGQEIG